MILRKKIFLLNSKATNALFCAMDKNKFNRILNHETTHDIWHTLEVSHKSINRVKESKINLLVHSFELFRMKLSEIISDMYTYFMDVINSLKALGKCFANLELINKVLRSLPKN